MNAKTVKESGTRGRRLPKWQPTSRQRANQSLSPLSWVLVVLAVLGLAGFKSVDEAAIAALSEAKVCTTHVPKSMLGRECGGYIYQTKDGYEYTAPITSGSPNSIDLIGVYNLQWNWVADYHTHPCVGHKELNEYFSMQDILSNEGLKLTGYMLNLCTGHVRRWAFGDDKDDIEVDFHSGYTIYLTSGHIVGFVK